MTDNNITFPQGYTLVWLGSVSLLSFYLVEWKLLLGTDYLSIREITQEANAISTTIGLYVGNEYIDWKRYRSEGIYTYLDTYLYKPRQVNLDEHPF